MSLPKSVVNTPTPTAHVSFGTVTIVVVERLNTPPPELLKVPNPYIRNQLLPPIFQDLFTCHSINNDAIAMMIRFTKELANSSPDLFIPMPGPDADDFL